MRLREIAAALLALCCGCASPPAPPAAPVDAGLEYWIRPGDMLANGDFNNFVLTTTPEAGPCWIAQKNIDFMNSLYNFVECRFPARPAQPYRCWAYVGGCCVETLQASFQTTDGTTKVKGRAFAIDPGDKIADPIRFDRTGLPKVHADHGGEQRPTRWMWVELPLPRYEKEGMKQIRLLTDQKGFAVAAFRISATMSDAPQGPPFPQEPHRKNP